MQKLLISDAQHLMAEFNFLQRKFCRNGYGVQEIELAIRKSLGNRRTMNEEQERKLLAEQY